MSTCDKLNKRILWGYVPIISMWAGGFRIHQMIRDHKQLTVAQKIVIVIRSIFEILCVGLVFGVLVDLPITFIRHMFKDDLNMFESARKNIPPASPNSQDGDTTIIS